MAITGTGPQVGSRGRGGATLKPKGALSEALWAAQSLRGGCGGGLSQNLITQDGAPWGRMSDTLPHPGIAERTGLTGRSSHEVGPETPSVLGSGQCPMLTEFSDRPLPVPHPGWSLPLGPWSLRITASWVPQSARTHDLSCLLEKLTVHGLSLSTCEVGRGSPISSWALVLWSWEILSPEHWGQGPWLSRALPCPVSRLEAGCVIR